MPTIFTELRPGGFQAAGYIPAMLEDAASAKAAFNTHYEHGGGWRPLKGWVYDPILRTIKYPGDRALQPYLEARLTDCMELVLVYPFAWVCIVEPDGAYEVARVD